MDEDAISTPLKMYFICDGPETPTQKLVQATSKGYPGLLAYAEAVGNEAILMRLKEARDFEGVGTTNSASVISTMSLSRSPQRQLVSV